MKPNPALLSRDRNAIPGFPRGLRPCGDFSASSAAGTYRIVFFLNDVPPVCPDARRLLRRRFEERSTTSTCASCRTGTPAVSSYDAFLHVRPSADAERDRARRSATRTSSRPRCYSRISAISVLPGILPGRPSTLQQRREATATNMNTQRLHRDGVPHVRQHGRDRRRHVRDQQRAAAAPDRPRRHAIHDPRDEEDEDTRWTPSSRSRRSTAAPRELLGRVPVVCAVDDEDPERAIGRGEQEARRIAADVVERERRVRRIRCGSLR